MSAGLHLLLTFFFSALTGAAIFYKAFLHSKYYDEILKIRGENSFRSEENNIFTGVPLWKKKANATEIPPASRFETELITPTFKAQNIGDKTSRTILLEKRIRITLIVFYISASLMALVLFSGDLSTTR